MRPRPKVAEDAFIAGAAATQADRARRKVPPADVIHTSLDLPRDLHRRARIAALEDGYTLKDVIIQALTLYLHEREQTRA